MATLLIVDDDSLIRDTLHDLFCDTHECHTADRAEQALAYLDVETYDVVLTDIAMPELSGRELLKQIQVNHPATPVIVISGLSNEADARALMDLGAFAYFAKPFKLEDIEEAVDRAIVRHQELTAQAQIADKAEDAQPARTMTNRPKLN
jgi:DNA-binding NtrC family response regulator